MEWAALGTDGIVLCKRASCTETPKTDNSLAAITQALLGYTVCDRKM